MNVGAGSREPRSGSLPMFLIAHGFSTVSLSLPLFSCLHSSSLQPFSSTNVVSPAVMSRIWLVFSLPSLILCQPPRQAGFPTTVHFIHIGSQLDSATRRSYQEPRCRCSPVCLYLSIKFFPLCSSPFPALQKFCPPAKQLPRHAGTPPVTPHAWCA